MLAIDSAAEPRQLRPTSIFTIVDLTGLKGMHKPFCLNEEHVTVTIHTLLSLVFAPGNGKLLDQG